MTHFRDQCSECGRITRQCRCWSDIRVTNNVVCFECRQKSETFVPTNEKLDPNLIPTLEDQENGLNDLTFHALTEKVNLFLEKRDQAIEDELAMQLMELGWKPPRDSRWYKEPEFVDNSFQMLIDGEVYTFGLIGVENQEDEGDGE